MAGSAVPHRVQPANTATGLIDIVDLADRVVTAVVTPITTDAGISREHWRALMLLAGHNGRSMGDIASRVGVPAATATRIVDRLVSDALAYRRSDPWDRRRVLVHISASGQQLLARIAAAIDAALGHKLTELDPADLATLRNTLGQLANS